MQMIEFVDALLLLFLFFPPSNWGYYIFACVCNRTKLKRFLFQVHRQVMEIYNGYNCIVLSSENFMKIQLDLWIDGNMGVSLLNRSGWERKQSFLWLDRWCLDSWGWTSSSSLSPWEKIQKSTPPKKQFSSPCNHFSCPRRLSESMEWVDVWMDGKNDAVGDRQLEDGLVLRPQGELLRWSVKVVCRE